MQVKDFEIAYTTANSIFKLYLIGCIHAGTIHCLEDKVKVKIKEIKDTPNAYFIGMGDYGEFITPRDPRFDPSQKAIAPWVEQDDIARCQEDWVANLFEPIKAQCIGLLYGNHEETFRKYNYGNVQKHICESLGVDNLGFSCFVRLFFRRDNSNESHQITLALTHGSGSAITKGAKLNKLRRFMDDFNARIYGFGHMHDIIQDTKPYLSVSPKGKIKQVEAKGVVTGSWFRTYTQGIIASYGEGKNYPPTTIGCPVFTIDVNEDSIDIDS